MKDNTRLHQLEKDAQREWKKIPCRDHVTWLRAGITWRDSVKSM